jgi:hypothetical protein
VPYPCFRSLGWLQALLKRHPVASRREVRAQDDLALETARLETAVCLGHLIEGDPLGDARPDGAGCQQAEEPLQPRCTQAARCSSWYAVVQLRISVAASAASTPAGTRVRWSARSVR